MNLDYHPSAQQALRGDWRSDPAKRAAKVEQVTAQVTARVLRVLRRRQALDCPRDR